MKKRTTLGAAIELLEEREIRAEKAKERYCNKGDKIDSRVKGASNVKGRNGAYSHASDIEDYIEELKEVINFLKNQDPLDRAILTNEYDVEDCLNGEIQEEAFCNTVASITECKEIEDTITVLVICIFRSLKDI